MIKNILRNIKKGLREIETLIGQNLMIQIKKRFEFSVRIIMKISNWQKSNQNIK